MEDVLAMVGVRAGGAAPAAVSPESLERRTKALLRQADMAELRARDAVVAEAEAIGMQAGLSADESAQFRDQAKERARQEHAKKALRLRARAARLIRL